MRSGWVGGSQMKRGVQEKGGARGPDPPSGHAYEIRASFSWAG